MAVPAEFVKKDHVVLSDPTPQPKEKKKIERKYVFMNMELLERRKRLLYLHYCGTLNDRAIKLLVNQINENNRQSGFKRKPLTVTAVQKDLQRMGSWEPFIWAMCEAHEDAKDYLNLLQLAREKALVLMATADNDSAKVGAIGKLISVVTAEIRLRQSLGLLPNVERVNIGDTTNIQQNIIVDPVLLKRYNEVIRRSRKLVSVQENDSAESVDSVETSDNV